MPTDFLGMTYESVDPEVESTVRAEVTGWIRNDLRIGNPRLTSDQFIRSETNHDLAVTFTYQSEV